MKSIITVSLISILSSLCLSAESEEFRTKFCEAIEKNMMAKYASIGLSPEQMKVDVYYDPKNKTIVHDITGSLVKFSSATESMKSILDSLVEGVPEQLKKDGFKGLVVKQNGETVTYSLEKEKVD